MFLKYIYIPISFKILIAYQPTSLKWYIHAYNNIKKINLTIQSIFCKLDSSTNTLSYYTIKNNSNLHKTHNQIIKIIMSFDILFWKKVKFKGKGFRLKIKQESKIIKFFFGHSHINLLLLKKTFLKKLSKYKFLIKTSNLKTLNYTAKIITNIKPINTYTNRGIRISRQIIKKRKGKKGSYV